MLRTWIKIYYVHDYVFAIKSLSWTTYNWRGSPQWLMINLVIVQRYTNSWSASRIVPNYIFILYMVHSGITAFIFRRIAEIMVTSTLPTFNYPWFPLSFRFIIPFYIFWNGLPEIVKLLLFSFKGPKSLFPLFLLHPHLMFQIRM